MNSPIVTKKSVARKLLESSNPLKVIDLFAGAGGFSLAANNIGMQILAAVENDKWAQETYLENFVTSGRIKQSPKLYGDITENKPATVKKRIKLKNR